jgi:DNA-binding transcriptional MerR regulator
MNLDGRMSIGDLSKEAGVKVVTIRYYEQIKLMPPPRTEGNYRAYEQEHVHRLRFIHRCRSFGFTLDQVRDFLRLSTQPKQKCSEVDRITANHLKEIERKAPTCEGLRPNWAESSAGVREKALSAIAAFWKLCRLLPIGPT